MSKWVNRLQMSKDFSGMGLFFEFKVKGRVGTIVLSQLV